MRAIRVLLSCLAAVVIAAASSQSASAHVLIRDARNNVSAVLHITPDDDPIAGEPSSMYFDIQGHNFNNDRYIYTFTAKDEAGVVQKADVTVNSSVAAADYTFPAQGLYGITLTIAPKAANGTPVILQYTQRVSRGAPAKVASATAYPAWAEPMLISGAVILILLVATGFTKRREIIAYSKFK